MEIGEINAASGKCYELGILERGHYQYVDRFYQFDYIPPEMDKSLHIKTWGDDKLICENDECFSFDCDKNLEIYVLYPDKQPVLPCWLKDYERTRMNVTRIDSSAHNLKGYFGVYKKSFPKGRITLYGNSTEEMLREEWYVSSNGAGYCMYSACVKEAL